MTRPLPAAGVAALVHPPARLISHSFKRYGMMEGLDETFDSSDTMPAAFRLIRVLYRFINPE